MIALATAHAGARVVDSLLYSNGGTAAMADGLRCAGIDCLAGYLGAITRARIGHLFAAGLAFTPVTFAGEYEDGAIDEIGQLKALDIPPRAAVWLDVEGMKAFRSDSKVLIGKIDAWASSIDAAGYVPMIYVGVPQQLTSDELWKLKVRGYWKGMGSVRDRFNALAEPTECGWMMTQLQPSVPCGGVLVDHNMVGKDFKGRTFQWVTGPYE